MVLSLQYCKLLKEQNENAEEWMGSLEYKQTNVVVKEKIAGWINSDDMITKIIR